MPVNARARTYAACTDAMHACTYENVCIHKYTCYTRTNAHTHTRTHTHTHTHHFVAVNTRAHGVEVAGQLVAVLLLLLEVCAHAVAAVLAR